MKFLNKTEARKFLEEKHISNSALTEEELVAIKEFFTEDELADQSFQVFRIEDCHKGDIPI